jgi:hypothetical protein
MGIEYYNNTLCISATTLVEKDIMSYDNYKKLSIRGGINVVRQGKGPGKYALVEVDTLPDRFKQKVKEIFPDGPLMKLQEWFRSNYVFDDAARSFFSKYRVNGNPLPAEKQTEYTANASTINAILSLINNSKALRQTMGGCGQVKWEDMSAAIAFFKNEFGHTLPESTLRFRKKVSEYRRDGYESLISGKFGNQNTRKVNHHIEQLLLGIASLPNKPFNTNVAEMYNMFVCGELDVYDPQTGELFDPERFIDKNGNPMSLSESCIANYLNAPKNKVLLAREQMSWSTFMHEQRPYMHRHAPEFSLSKISFDDRDLPRKLKDTKQRPKAYYAYDVTSGCVIGRSYSRFKNVDLVIDVFRDMFRTIQRNGWNCPAQVEVENHLMSQWADNFLAAGTVFPFVRFCAALNSQEKRAEHLNGAKKISVEHKNHTGIGRFYAKRDKYRTESRKVSDETNDTYEEKEYFTWDELIAEDISDCNEFNHQLHPNQKMYPMMTRWDVLVSNINPNLQPIDKAVLYRYIGEHEETSVRRNHCCRLMYKDWWLSSPDVISRLSANNYKVDAYYLPDLDGEVSEVFIYQNGVYVDSLKDLGTYNEALAERTENDTAIFEKQQSFASKFDKSIKDKRIQPVGVMKRGTIDTAPIDDLIVDVPLEIEEDPDDYTLGMDYGKMALEQL